MTGRRHFLRLAGAAALLPLAMRVRAAASAFAPPAEPMRYTRSLRREMVDGAAMTARRTFTVRFVPRATGFTVEGEESAPPEVSAPAALETFAQLERQRRETGLFPLALDPTGRIVPEPGEASAPELDRAVEEALHRIAESGRGADDEAAMRAFVLGLQQAAASLVTAPPPDLFHPVSTPLRETRQVALPGGETGEVTLAFTATADPATGLMRTAERIVVTRLAGSERRTVESWTLAPQ